jgi:thioredoxin 1
MSRPLSRKEFEKEVSIKDHLSLVQFRLEWSGACQIILPVYEELSVSYGGQVDFYTIDVEKEQGLDQEFGINELPTILFFKGGKIVDHIRGLVPKNVMISKIENALTGTIN